MLVHQPSLQQQTLLAEGSDPSDSTIASEEQTRVQKLLAELPSREQEVLSLRLQEGLSYKQIAEVLDISVSHVGVLIHQAVVRMRTVLEHDT